MSAFDAAKGVEARANALLLPYLEEVSDRRLVLTNKGTLARWLQESVGDVLLMARDEMKAIELKAELRFTKNVFLETFSNRNLENRDNHARFGQSIGWLMTIRADLLLYYFIDKDVLIAFDVFELKRWMFGCGEHKGAWCSGKFTEAVQRRYTQANDTWGLIVPIRVLYNEMPRGCVRWTTVKQRELALATA